MYNKSALKIYEFLMNNLGRGIIVEDLIRLTGVGRTSGFDSVDELVKSGIAVEKRKGRQREISLKIDMQSLSFKLFADSFRFKNLDNNLKFVINLFVEYCKSLHSVKSLLLFGSSIENRNYKDIDIAIIVGKADREKIFAIRNKLESISDKVLNVHFFESISLERFSKSLCVCGFDYCLSSIMRNEAKESFIDAVEWFNSYQKNKSGFDNLLVNLGFAYCYFNGIYPKTKEEAKSLLLKKYPDLNRGNVKKAVREIGEEIFR